MKYYSTNRKVREASFEEAVLKGLPDDNGLYMPSKLPHVGDDFLQKLPNLTFREIAFYIASYFIEDEIKQEALQDDRNRCLRFRSTG